MLVRPVLVNYKGASDTIACLTSLAEQVGVNIKPIVVDNASGDGSVERIREAHPGVELIQSAENTGFCGGNNIGIRHALESGCDYIFLLNNDTVLEPDCISTLLACAIAHPEAGVVGPAIYFFDRPESPWFTGSKINIWTGSVEHEHTDVRKEPSAQPFDIPWITGCAMLVSAEVMKRIGGFDDRFFCYFEDIDWSYRAKKMGYQCLLCPKAILYHKVGSTTNKISHNMDYYVTRNRILFISKHAPLLVKSLYVARVVKQYLQWSGDILLSRSKGGDSIRSRVLQTAVIDYLRGRFGKCAHVWR